MSRPELDQPRRIGRRSVRGEPFLKTLGSTQLGEVERDLAAVDRLDLAAVRAHGLTAQLARLHLALDSSAARFSQNVTVSAVQLSRSTSR